MQRRNFFKVFAAAAGYLGVGKIAQAHTLPSIAPEALPVDNVISAGPPVTADDYVSTTDSGPYIVSLIGLRFIIPAHYMAARYYSEFTIHMASGEVLKNKVAKTDGGRFIEIGESLEIPILDHLIDTAAMWPELDPDDELNDALAGRARKASIWVPRICSRLHGDSERAKEIRAFHAASIGKSTHYSDWPV